MLANDCLAMNESQIAVKTRYIIDLAENPFKKKHERNFWVSQKNGNFTKSWNFMNLVDRILKTLIQKWQSGIRFRFESLKKTVELFKIIETNNFIFFTSNLPSLIGNTVKTKYQTSFKTQKWYYQECDKLFNEFFYQKMKI